MPEKYEREIEEIVNKAGDLGPQTPLRQVFIDALLRLGQQFTTEFPRMFRWVTPTRVGVLGIILLPLGLVARAPVIAILAVGVLLGAYLLAVARSRGMSQEVAGYDRTWRGASMDDRPPSSLRSWLRRWFGGEG